MPVTVTLEHHEPRVHPPIQHAETLDQMLQQSCPFLFSTGKTRILRSSFSRDAASMDKVYASSSSFVRSAIEAWARHSHLVFRPDDVWFQILVQLSFYMGKNGETLRHLFVSHQEKEEIEIIDDDWSTIIARFEEELEKKVKTPWLAEWVRPSFSTSGADDRLTAIVLLMGLVSTYFDYAAYEICGIPSITLLGTKQDWEGLLEKTNRLQDFGEESDAYRHRLRPILLRIVKTFDEPSSEATKAFWDQMVHAKVKHDNMCGRPPVQYTISGWILGLYYWNDSGLQVDKLAQGLHSWRDPGDMVFDAIHYGEEYLENLPVGFGKVKLKFPKMEGQPENERWQGWLVAGSIGKRITSGAPQGYLQSDASSRASSELDCNSTLTVDSGNSVRRDRSRLSNAVRNLRGLRGPSTKGANRPSGKDKTNKIHEALSSYHATATTSIAAERGHGTIQPRSGWVLFGPKQEPPPFLSEAETWGPTVEAIDSCANVEHYGSGAPSKKAISRTAEESTGLYRLPRLVF